MKTISLKIEDNIFGDVERIVKQLKKPRNRYINEAIDYYNKIQKYRFLEQKLKKESALVKEDSISILKEFEKIDYED
jgi:predicted transcriptional regulator